ncbi:MAG TPA: ABC transporter substrate-binding protein [Streptosporangiaceae bacterium]|jgi:peptide/nickel transport system substrate-binding protein|nr:ABC transporter substrate-binding protein [Streptosporangiaceae bacterium]
MRQMLSKVANRAGRPTGLGSIAALAVVALAAAGCGSSSGPSGNSSSTTSGQAGGTFTILANSAFGVADPAQNYTLEEWQLLINTHDGLTAFARVGGVAGTKIVPDLATAIPVPTNGGKTYLFHVRRGIKFSNGQVLKPSDFLTTFERQFTVPGGNPGFYSGIVGTSACSTKGCNLSKGVVANDSNYTLTINLSAPDPELMDQLALPFAFAVPAGTSMHLTGNNVPPGTGPYMWKSYNPNTEAVLVRNPYFHVWSKVAQPAGYPNEIIEKYGLPVSDEVTEVQNGEADEVFDGDQIPSDQLSTLNSSQYASQVHVNTLTADWYMALNTTRPPFNNLDARQAINYAANRSAYVKIAGGPSLAVPACQILPPNFPSYKAYCPYTTGSQTVWSAPNLAKAKALVKASGTLGDKVVVNGTNDQVGTELAEQMVSDLDSIGYKASTQLLTAAAQYPFVQNSANSSKWNVAWSAWYQDYPAPSDFLNVLLGCGSIAKNSDASPNIAAFCDPSIQKQISQAESEEATNPSGASALWTQIDHEDTVQAPWVDLYNPKQIDFLAKDVHGYQWNPQWYILIDQLWLSK